MVGTNGCGRLSEYFVLGGLVLGMIGDIGLNQRAWAPIGAAAFAVGHVSFLIAFTMHPSDLTSDQVTDETGKKKISREISVRPVCACSMCRA